MKIELSGEEKAVIAVYLNSFEIHYKDEKKKHVSKQFRKAKERFLANSDKVDAKVGDWAFIINSLKEGKRLIDKNLPEVDKMVDAKEKYETTVSMMEALSNIDSALNKIQEKLKWIL